MKLQAFSLVYVEAQEMTPATTATVTTASAVVIRMSPVHAVTRVWHTR